MEKYYKFFLPLMFVFVLITNIACAQSKSLKLVFIRHGERPDNGDNLTCKGFNRSLLLPALLYKKFGLPDNIYVPSLNLGKSTKRARMFQTITPFAVKYNLSINSQYDEEDYKHISKALLQEKGTILIIWEHNTITPLLDYLGIKTSSLNWPDSDYDSIWIVTFKKGQAILTKDREGLNPSDNCSF